MKPRGEREEGVRNRGRNIAIACPVKTAHVSRVFSDAVQTRRIPLSRLALGNVSVKVRRKHTACSALTYFGRLTASREDAYPPWRTPQRDQRTQAVHFPPQNSERGLRKRSACPRETPERAGAQNQVFLEGFEDALQQFVDLEYALACARSQFIGDDNHKRRGRGGHSCGCGGERSSEEGRVGRDEPDLYPPGHSAQTKRNAWEVRARDHASFRCACLSRDRNGDTLRRLPTRSIMSEVSV